MHVLVYIEQIETRAGRASRTHHVTSRPQTFSFFFFYGEFVHALPDARVRDNEVSIDGRMYVLSTRSRVEIDKRHMRTSVTYLTGVLDSFGVKKSLRFPARYQLSRSVVASSPLYLSMSFFSHNGLKRRDTSNIIESAKELPRFKGQATWRFNSQTVGFKQFITANSIPD